jgi:DNA polymerase
MTDLRNVLQLRLESAKSSVKKFSAFVDNTSNDLRLRNQFVYAGAHTLRWSGRGVQPQNLTRKETDKETLEALLNGRPVKSLEGLTTCLRPCIRAPKGKKLVVADLSAIENRVLAWLSGCTEMLAIYEKGLDPYKVFAVQMYYDDHWLAYMTDEEKYASVTKDQRQLCKPAVLGCGYGLGGGQEREMQNGQKVKTGLWKYAESMGVSLSREQAHRMVQVFRSAYPEVLYYWNYLEDAFIAAYRTKKRQQVGAIFFEATPECVKVLLPSGRYIHYLNAHAYQGAEGIKISFDGYRMGGWGRQSTYGGRLTENIVQAVARDVLAEGMLRAEQSNLTIVGHVHDEVICEQPIEWELCALALEKSMAFPIDWAPGLPLAAEGSEMEFYAK